MNKKGFWGFGHKKKMDEHVLSDHQMARLEAAYEDKEEFIAEIQTEFKKQNVEVTEQQLSSSTTSLLQRAGIDRLLKTNVAKNAALLNYTSFPNKVKKQIKAIRVTFRNFQNIIVNIWTIPVPIYFKGSGESTWTIYYLKEVVGGQITVVGRDKHKLNESTIMRHIKPGN